MGGYATRPGDRASSRTSAVPAQRSFAMHPGSPTREPHGVGAPFLLTNTGHSCNRRSLSFAAAAEAPSALPTSDANNYGIIGSQRITAVIAAAQAPRAYRCAQSYTRWSPLQHFILRRR